VQTLQLNQHGLIWSTWNDYLNTWASSTLLILFSEMLSFQKIFFPRNCFSEGKLRIWWSIWLYIICQNGIPKINNYLTIYVHSGGSALLRNGNKYPWQLFYHLILRPTLDWLQGIPRKQIESLSWILLASWFFKSWSLPFISCFWYEPVLSSYHILGLSCGYQ